MADKQISLDEKKAITRKAKTEAPAQSHAGGDKTGLTSLQRQVGNRAVQRLLAQRSGDGPAELDDETASKINSARGGGQPLDSTVQAQMGTATGHDFSDVRVHTGPESHTLNQQLGAKAFTTGRDIFFRSGAYSPGSSGGQELLAHELTHVVQQGTGRVGGGSRMTVNAPGDTYEQEADSVAKTVTSSPTAQAGVQRQEEQDELQMKRLQLQEEEDDEDVQEKPLQLAEDEDELQMKPLQLAEDEDELQMKQIQRQEEEDEEVS